MKALVVGSGGFLGRRLCAALAAAGFHPIAASSADGSGIHPETGALAAGFAIPPATDAVIYLAQSPHGARMPAFAAHLFTVNAVTPVRVAALARAAGVRRFIYASTGTVYRPSFSPLRESDAVRRDHWYALSKLHAEETLALLQAEIDVTSVRIFGLYGAGQTNRLIPNLIATVADARPVYLEPPGEGAALDGGLKLSLLHVDDAARLIVALIAEHAIPVLNLASDEALDIRGIAALIGERMGITPRLEQAARARQGNLLADVGLLERTLAPRFTSFAAALGELVEQTLPQRR